MSAADSLEQQLGGLKLDHRDEPDPEVNHGKVEQGTDDVSSSEEEQQPQGVDTADGANGGAVKKPKKKKKKKKSKAKKTVLAHHGGCVPPEQLIVHVEETPEQAAYWKQELWKGRPTVTIPEWGLLNDNFRSNLDIFLTPSCRSFELFTPRLRLRQVRPDMADCDAIRRIKTEPVVQRTQLYGSPSRSAIRDNFQNRYVRSSMPGAGSLGHLGVGQQANSTERDEYVFAITLKDPETVKIGNGVGVGLMNRIRNAEGYLGNIGLELRTNRPLPACMRRKKGRATTHPTFKQCEEAQLSGSMYYELHPQVWGKGIAGEAFAEVLRFAIEELGCIKISADPTKGNEASIKMCLKNGMKYTHTASDNPFNKPQLFHSITRDEWFKLNQPDGSSKKDPWGGKEVCRWCLNFRLASPKVQCEGCAWARYCSRDCQRADWVKAGGHQAECDMSHVTKEK